MIFDIIACIPTRFVEIIILESCDNHQNFNEVLRLARLTRLYRLLRIVRFLKILKYARES